MFLGANQRRSRQSRSPEQARRHEAIGDFARKPDIEHRLDGAQSVFGDVQRRADQMCRARACLVIDAEGGRARQLDASGRHAIVQQRLRAVSRGQKRITGGGRHDRPWLENGHAIRDSAASLTPA